VHVIVPEPPTGCGTRRGEPGVRLTMAIYAVAEQLCVAAFPPAVLLNRRLKVGKTFALAEALGASCLEGVF
jgi:hypothetical protein